MSPNTLEVVVLPDGTVRVTTGNFAGPQHMTADAFMLWVQRELGGDTRVAHGHTHAHDHDHDHDHDHQKAR